MNIRKVIARGMLGVGVFCFAALFVLSGYFMGNRPHEPQLELGLVFQFQQHGGVVYLTHYERLLMSALPWVAASLIGAGAAILANLRTSNKILR